MWACLRKLSQRTMAVGSRWGWQKGKTREREIHVLRGCIAPSLNTLILPPAVHTAPTATTPTVRLLPMPPRSLVLQRRPREHRSRHHSADMDTRRRLPCPTYPSTPPQLPFYAQVAAASTLPTKRTPAALALCWIEAIRPPSPLRHPNPVRYTSPRLLGRRCRRGCPASSATFRPG